MPTGYRSKVQRVATPTPSGLTLLIRRTKEPKVCTTKNTTPALAFVLAAVLAPVAVLIDTPWVHAASPAVKRPGMPDAAEMPSWSLGVSAWSASGLIFKRRAIFGVAGHVNRSIFRTPAFLHAYLAWGRNNHYGTALRLEHQHIQGALGAGARLCLGAGCLWWLSRIGVRHVLAHQRHHQPRRLQAADIDLTHKTSWQLLPAAEFESGARVSVLANFHIDVSAGPWIAFLKQRGAARHKLVAGWNANVGAGYDF